MPKALTEYDKNVGKKVRNYRIIHDISQDALAKYIGLTKQAISRIENGKRRISIEELEKTALFFDEPIQLFLKDGYIYTYPTDTAFGTLSVSMAKFLDDYSQGLQTDEGKDNLTHKSTKRFINAVMEINRTVRDHQKLKEKREGNNLR